MHRHVALLRGINVGGNNLIKMLDLRASFEGMGFTDVATYIQSGNVTFTSKLADKTRLEKTIETTLSEAFGYASRVVLVSAAELARVLAQAPAGFGKQPDRHRYDVLFVKAPLAAGEVLRQLTPRPGVDAVHAGQHALYFQRLISKASQSHLTKLIQLPVYKSITIRNWNTTNKLLAMVNLTPR
jgi:uncharacterized protein (DUF1697 family)